MSLQTKLRIYIMIAVMYKDEHENVINTIARYVLVNIVLEKLAYRIGERNKMRLRR